MLRKSFKPSNRMDFQDIYSFPCLPQTDDMGKGGAGNDAVTASIQDFAGADNADFSSPPELVQLTTLQSSMLMPKLRFCAVMLVARQCCSSCS